MICIQGVKIKIRILSIVFYILLLAGCAGEMPATPAILIEPALAFTPSFPAETARKAKYLPPRSIFLGSLNKDRMLRGK